MDLLFLDFLFELGPIVWVQRFFGPGHPLPFRLLSLLASTWGVLFALALGLWIWGRDDAYALAGIVSLEATVNLALNQLLSVPRPAGPEIVRYEHIDLGSFPSGHVFTATALWGLLWARGRVPLWLAALVVLGVAVGRLYLGVHYLADVVVGAALGGLVVGLFRAVWPAVRRWLGERTYAFFVAAALVGAASAVGGLLLAEPRNHFMHNAVGVAVGGAAALLIEHRRVRFTPAATGRAGRLGRVGLGLLGIAPLAAADRLTGESTLWLGTALAAVAAVWALLGAPALFQRLGWGERRPGTGSPSPPPGRH